MGRFQALRAWPPASGSILLHRMTRSLENLGVPALLAWQRSQSPSRSCKTNQARLPVDGKFVPAQYVPADHGYPRMPLIKEWQSPNRRWDREPQCWNVQIDYESRVRASPGSSNRIVRLYVFLQLHIPRCRDVDCRKRRPGIQKCRAGLTANCHGDIRTYLKNVSGRDGVFNWSRQLFRSPYEITMGGSTPTCRVK